jgi:Leucine-rich repeat (LRR) protein
MNRFSSVKINPININPMDITFGSLNILNDIVQQANDFITSNINETTAESSQPNPNEVADQADEDQAEEHILAEEIPTEREVLTHLFECMGGNQWTKRTNWMSSKHIGQWYEVKVNAQGKVFRIGLGNNKLVASLPSNIDKLSALQILDISKNKITGELPSNLGNLSELRCFYADGNDFNSKIPHYLGNLTKLSQLNLANNQLMEAIPSSFGNLTELTELILSKNYISGHIPSSLGSLYQLEKLYLNHNGLTGPIPSTFVSLCNLKDLNLSHNELSGTLPDNWSHLIALESLSLANNQFSGIIPSSLFQLSHLKSLHLQHNKFLGTITIPATQALFALEELDLSNNSLSGRIPCLSKFEHLKVLNLSNNQLKCRNLDDCLQQLAKLKHVDLSHNKITGYLPRKLFHTASGLTFISVSHNDIHGMIPYSIAKLIHAETIDFSHNQLHGELPENSYDGLQRLQIFNISYNNISGNIPEVIFDLPHLKDFDISYNNYPIENMRCYLTGNRFTTAEKIIFSRELTCADTDLNSLQVVIRIARILISSVFSTSSSPNHAANGSHDNKQLGSPDAKHENKTDRNGSTSHDTSSDLQVFMMLVLNHRELVMQAVCISDNKASSDNNNATSQKDKSGSSSKSNSLPRIKWCINPGYLIKLIKVPFYDIFTSLIKVESESMLGPLILLKMYSVVTYAQRNDPSSEREFVEYEDGLAEALRTIFSLASVDDHRALLYKMLLPGRSPHVINMLADSKDGSGIFELLAPDSIIGICLDRNLKPVFSSPNVAMIITEIFSTPSRSRAIPDTSSFPASLQDDYSYQSKIQQFINHLAKSFQNARYCPIIMFFLNCMTKVLTLALSTTVLFRPTYSINSESPIIEWILVTMVSCTVLYEFGQFHEAKYVFNEYAETVWNKMDVFTCISLSYWVCGFLSGKIDREPSFTLAMAISAIPQSLSLLQYLCINKALGQLVIMIFAM